MTGAYLRVKRGNKFENIEVEFLSDEERKFIFSDRKPDELISWMNLLSKKLEELDPLLKSLIDDGVIRTSDTSDTL